MPTAEPPCPASSAFRSVEHPHRTGEYASGALGRGTPWPQDLAAPHAQRLPPERFLLRKPHSGYSLRYGTVVSKVGLGSDFVLRILRSGSIGRPAPGIIAKSLRRNGHHCAAQVDFELDQLRRIAGGRRGKPALFATLPAAAPSGPASEAFRSVARPHRSDGYASGALGRKTPQPQDLTAPHAQRLPPERFLLRKPRSGYSLRYGRVVNKAG